MTQSYAVRSNHPWQIVAKADGDWVKAFPAEGKDDGIFKIIVYENNTFDARTMNFAILIDGKEEYLEKNSYTELHCVNSV